MRHKIAGKKLGRTSEHRKAMFANMAMALVEHEQIRTTLPKAKELRRVIEPMVTMARKGTLAARRDVAAKLLNNETLAKKLVDDIAPRFADTPGGYTRVLKAGFRNGDKADMAIIEFTTKPTTKVEKNAPKAKEEKAAE